jgi:hypothetical protein
VGCRTVGAGVQLAVGGTGEAVQGVSVTRVSLGRLTGLSVTVTAGALSNLLAPRKNSRPTIKITTTPHSIKTLNRQKRVTRPDTGIAEV